MEVKTFSYRLEDLDLHPEDAEAFIGYEPGQCPEPVRHLIEAALVSAKDYCDIKGGYLILDHIAINKDNFSIQIDGVELDVKKIICNQIRKSESLALFVCTAGPGISHRSEQLMQQGDILEAYLLDVVGSEIVEAAMDKIQDELEHDLSTKGLHITNRYSPGYCDWNVSEQHKLFSFFPPGFCGVTLTSSALMQPVKSVSGIIGLGPEVRRKPYACNICDMANCIYRMKKN